MSPKKMTTNKKFLEKPKQTPPAPRLRPAIESNMEDKFFIDNGSFTLPPSTEEKSLVHPHLFNLSPNDTSESESEEVNSPLSTACRMS